MLFGCFEFFMKLEAINIEVQPGSNLSGITNYRRKYGRCECFSIKQIRKKFFTHSGFTS